ncbi:hypothetical protein MAIT1_03821 [Magnetofaba australis IT-1]|uniref:Uncharacterized protein n=1 Tax=Magnetofaba australis IT-1 TaxID=1434232 RepID=A0A1Y2K9T7_9PROT|nr:hypothetical protein MAIT1_03821 [Magnetofaba australis IT-1]
MLSMVIVGALSTAFAEPPPPIPSKTSSLSQEQKTASKLNDIQEDLKQRKLERDKLAAEIKRASPGPEKAELEARLEQVNATLAEQKHAFSMIITGGLELELIEAGKQKEKYDWERDLLEIVQPIMSELRALTESKRQQQNLKNRIDFHTEQLRIGKEAMRNIEAIDQKSLDRVTLKQYEQVAEQWRDKIREHQHLLEVAELQLEELTRSKETLEQSWKEQWEEFIQGRGATLILSLLAAFGVYLALMLPMRIYGFATRNRQRRRPLWVRILSLSYRFLALLGAFIALFATVHHSGDRMLEGLFLLLAVAIIWSLKSTIPRYMDELKLLLNVSSVREGERVIFQDVPWRVDSLDMFARLSNPAMSQPRIRVPLKEMAQLHSRRPAEDENWFPCNVGDFVILSDGQFGLVKWISPETVALRVGGGAIRSYTTSDFLGASPQNLSTGFAIAINFGIDYKYQKDCLDDIPRQMAQVVYDRLKSIESTGPHLSSVTVDFAEAAASSLNYKVVALYSGAAAENYYPAQRAVNQSAVAACNQFGWEIPFTQVTLHQASAS